jgi:hypothetical protein
MEGRIPLANLRDVLAHVALVSDGGGRANRATVVGSLQTRTGADVAQVEQVIEKAQKYGLIQVHDADLEIPASGWPVR